MTTRAERRRWKRKGERKVALAGKAPTTAEMINLEPDDVEIWGMSDAYNHIKRPVDRWFEIHTPDDDGLYRGFTQWVDGGPEAHVSWLAGCGIPVYMNKVDPQISTSVAFPFHEIGSTYRHYWTSTVAYMLSLAAYEQVDEVHLWGIEMAGGTEFEHQRPCTEYWLGVLETQHLLKHGRKRVYIPDCAPLLKPYGGTYGIVTRKHLDAAAIQDEISRFDLGIVNGQPGAREGRKALLSLLERADPSTRGKTVEPQLIIHSNDPERLKKIKEEARAAVLKSL